MRKFFILMTCLTLAVVMSPAWTLAQTSAPSTPPAAAPPPGSSTPAPRPAEKMDRSMEPSQVEGTVKKVDPAENKIQVGSGLFGLFGRTVNVTSDTNIQVEGRKGTLADVREGSRAKVSYESRDGKNVATHIEVMPAERRTDKR